MANSLGYYEDSREEAGIDVNRDFPYSPAKTNCLTSAAAKIIYAIFKTNLIVSGVTFHAGDNAITYSWGTDFGHMYPGNKGHNTPDDSAFSTLALLLRKVADKAKEDSYYTVGKSTDVVYPADGTLEDWAYAEGWEKKTNPEFYPACHPHEILNNVKSLVYLVETSTNKDPNIPYLGMKSPDDACVLKQFSEEFRLDFKKLSAKLLTGIPVIEDEKYKALLRRNKIADSMFRFLQRNKAGNLHGSGDLTFEIEDCPLLDGHIPRNIRLGLTLIDMASPYIRFIDLQKYESQVSVTWTLGGSLIVDETFIVWDYYDNVMNKRSTFDFNQFFTLRDKGFYINEDWLYSLSDITDSVNQLGNILTQKTSAQTGAAVWGLRPTRFIENLPTKDDRQIIFFAVGKTDQQFSVTPSDSDPMTAPLSHFSNVRVNSKFKAFQVGDDGDQKLYSRYFVFSDVHII